MIKISATIPYQYDTIFSPFKANEFDEALLWAKNSGLDGVEIAIADYKSISVEEIKSLKERLNQLGLEVPTISTGQAFGREGLDLTSTDESVREKALKRLYEHIDAAQILNSKVTVGLLRGIGNAALLSQQKQWLKEQMVKVNEYAAKKNVTVLLEPLNRYETLLINSIEDAVNFFDGLKEFSNIKILWDVFHANIEDTYFDIVISKYVDVIGHIHFADTHRGFPGYGRLDFKEIYDCLNKNNYSGYVSLECLNIPSIDVVREKMPEFINSLR